MRDYPYAETPDDLRRMIIRSKSGQRVTYIVGGSTKGREMVRREAMRLYEKGLVNLFQIRLTPAPNGRFQYVAQRR